MGKITRREFLKSTGAVVAGIVAAPLIAQAKETPPQPAETPQKAKPFDPDAFAERILQGDRTTLDEAPGIPPRAIAQVGERIFVKIFKKNYQQTPEGIKTFQDFITLPCVPWNMCDSICRRICKRREVSAQKWLLGHEKLRARILNVLGNTELAQYPSQYWWRNRMPKRGIPFNEPEYWNEALSAPSWQRLR